MSRIKRSKEDLETQIKEQISFLITSCRLYDEGQHSEAKRLATILRILFHETNKSRSLLGQLHLRDIYWIDTADPVDPDNLVSHLGLFSIHFDGPSKRIPWLVPKGIPKETPISKLIKSCFNDWWLGKVVVAVKSNEKKFFSRKKLILNVTNTDGGAHVDSELDKSYYDLSKNNILGFTIIMDGKKFPLLSPELPCLRQIAHEVLLTLKEKMPEYFSEIYNSEIKIIPYGKLFENGFQFEQYSFEMYLRKPNT